MPYIKQESRGNIDAMVEVLDRYIMNEGDLNYAITRLALRFIIRQGLRYAILSTVIGTLRLAAAEIEQRLVRPYEDAKIKENGDVPEYQELIFPPKMEVALIFQGAEEMVPNLVCGRLGCVIVGTHSHIGR